MYCLIESMGKRRIENILEDGVERREEVARIMMKMMKLRIRLAVSTDIVFVITSDERFPARRPFSAQLSEQ